MSKKEEVWIKVAVAYVSDSNSRYKYKAVEWADFISRKYEDRFDEIEADEDIFKDDEFEEVSK